MKNLIAILILISLSLGCGTSVTLDEAAAGAEEESIITEELLPGTATIRASGRVDIPDSAE
jgi:uncharacterized protein YceK